MNLNSVTGMDRNIARQFNMSVEMIGTLLDFHPAGGLKFLGRKQAGHDRDSFNISAKVALWSEPKP